MALASAGPFEFTSDYRRKVAAVIGISRYAKMEDLEGARSDAAEVAELLRTLGFDAVYELYDEQATRPAILELLDFRGLSPDPALRHRILACTDLEPLDRWLRAAVTARSLDELRVP